VTVLAGIFSQSAGKLKSLIPVTCGGVVPSKAQLPTIAAQAIETIADKIQPGLFLNIFTSLESSINRQEDNMPEKLAQDSCLDDLSLLAG
jgi:hypothetical protein